MTLTPITFLIVCPMVFLAGLVDSIGGGGGLISLPAYLFAGLPIHLAIGTNKMSSCCGTAVAATRFAKNGLIDLKLAVPAIVMAIIGSSIGAHISMQMDERILRYLLIAVLPIAAYFVLNRHLFNDNGTGRVNYDRRTYLVACLSALLIGIYDGTYGPGTGTFLIIAFTVFAKLSIGQANGQTKAINLTTNLTSLVIFLLNGQVLVPLGIAAALCNMAGGYIGSGMAMQNGARIVRPIILVVLVLLFIKILTGS
ncbi:MAG: TSUP family transporter [Lachnospiraceae bacterium]|nr:TSUP family transporter [Lachnospiraceae bacterium]